MNLLIKGVQIVDGEGRKPYKADVLLQKNIISAIGDLKHKKADEVVEGLSNYLTPGFIDINTDSDHYLHLFTNPSQKDFINQGVTTIIGGHCGTSLAPLIYGTLESLEEWTDINKVNVNWHTVNEFLSSLEKVSLGVNFCTLVGHRTIRDAITRGEYRELTEPELKIFENVIERAMGDGAFGLSTGLDHIHGQYASEKEIKRLVGALKSSHGIYSTHLRNQTNELLKSVEETVRTANFTETKTLISHFRPIDGYEEQFQKSLEYINKNTPLGRLYFDVYPYDTSIYPIYKLLPNWAQLDSIEAMLEELRNNDTVAKIKENLLPIIHKLGAIRIASAPRNGYLVGRTIEQASYDLEASIPETLITIMNMTKFKATVFVQDINFGALVEALKNERAFIASNSSSPAPGEFMKHERSTNTFIKFLDLVRDRNLMSFEEAIKKITSAPALYFDIRDRGVIKEGKVADLVILGKDDYKIREVILGGKTCLPAGAVAKGRILRHKT